MPGPGQPMWTDDDQDKVIAWLRARHEICGQCGTAEADWVDPVSKRYLEVPKWEAVTFRCPGCAEVARTRDMIPKQSAGVRVVLVPLDPDQLDEDDDDDGPLPVFAGLEADQEVSDAAEWR